MRLKSSHRIGALLLSLVLSLSGCATLPDNTGRTESRVLDDTGGTLLGMEFHDEKLAHPGQSGFVPLANGLDAFVARVMLAQAAERGIDAQYYLIHDDLVGRLFIDQLLKAADRGVRVRLLVDDIDLGGRDFGLVALSSHPNIEVRIFNPFSRRGFRATQFLTRLGSVTRRMHNKSFTIDNQATIVGGRNIGNEYFDADPDLAFADLDVLAVGPVVEEVSASFDLYWQNELAYPANTLIKHVPTPQEAEQARRRLDEYVAQQTGSPYLKALGGSALADSIRNDSVGFFWGEARAIYDDPRKIVSDRGETDLQLASDLAPLLAGAREELIIVSPYFVPGKEGTAALGKLARQGVRVRILTNSLASTDVGVVHAGYARYRRTLLEAGVELYEMDKRLSREQRKEKHEPHGSSKASLHAKSFIIDRRKVFIGSFNLDPRSAYENTEIGIVLTSPELAGRMATELDSYIDSNVFRLELVSEGDGGSHIVWHSPGSDQVYTADPYTGFWRRMGIGLMGLLPIESQL